MYEPADFFMVRAALLPVETFDALDRGDLGSTLSEEARAALAVGSLSFADALRGAAQGGARRSEIDRALRRYLIRMSTRPTPFGLFAAAGIGVWGERTDLALAAGRRPQRTRADASWLLAVVDRAESIPGVRRQLGVVANRAAFIRAGRVVLAERVSKGEATVPPTVSIRATSVVRRALDAARTPLPYADLASLLLDGTPGATTAQVETLLAQLWEQTLLLSDLRPPLTVDSPARYVLERLAPIPEASELRTALQSVVDAATQWDAAPTTSEQPFRALVERAAAVAPFDRSPFQVDAGLALRGHTISRMVASEAARAAELLLRMSPAPHGPSHLEAYRRAFERQYGPWRNVPILELLDANVGLGPPSPSAPGAPAQSRGLADRNRLLLDLATAALRDGTPIVHLDDTTLLRLQSDDLSTETAPLSLDLTVLVSASSTASLDAGDFELAVGPNIGSTAAGRMLGRFADFVPGAHDALRRVATNEGARAPGVLMAELAYAPRSRRLGNVSTRPNLREYEIAIGVTSGSVPSRTIRVDELVVGVRGGRLCVRWATTGQEVQVTAGHMLSYARAPAVARFLSEVGRDGVCQLSGFQWGPASTFPYLPRLQSGRVILSLAQWRLGPATFSGDARRDVPQFRVALDEWRGRWNAPSRLAVAVGDQRLPLNLTRDGDIDELRRMLRRDAGPVTLTEVFPDVDGAWVIDGEARRIAAEFVVPLLRRAATVAPAAVPPRPRTLVDLRAPGSDWLFVKLYAGRDMENDVLAGPVREFVRAAAASGFGESFFIRYGDPGRHVRLRFRSDPGRLVSDLLPMVSEWATGLMARGNCLRFAFDTYEREIERFGGAQAMTAVEAMFMADSATVLQVLALLESRVVTAEPLAVAVLTVDALLDGLGLDPPARAEWCGARAGTRQESGADYRRWKALLRPLLADGDRVRRQGGGEELAAVLGTLRTAGVALVTSLDEIQARSALTCSPADLYGSLLHLHLNRLLAADHSTERRVFGLLGRLRAGLTSQKEVTRPKYGYGTGARRR